MNAMPNLAFTGGNAGPSRAEQIGTTIAPVTVRSCEPGRPLGPVVGRPGSGKSVPAVPFTVARSDAGMGRAAWSRPAAAAASATPARNGDG